MEIACPGQDNLTAQRPLRAHASLPGSHGPLRFQEVWRQTDDWIGLANGVHRAL
jgi:hypothetical protein